MLSILCAIIFALAALTASAEEGTLSISGAGDEIIGSDAFYGCANLTDVYYTGTQEQWNEISIKDRNENLTDATIHFETAAASVDAITVTLNGEKIETDTAPIIQNGRTMLPIRAVAEALGAEVLWDNEKREVIITNENTKMIIPIGSGTASVNGEEVTLDSAAFIESGRTYLPVRFVSEALGANVSWDNETRTVVIIK